MSSKHRTFYDVDKPGDELEISFSLFTPQKYNLMQRRMTKQEAILELRIKNISQDIISIQNPKLIICRTTDYKDIDSLYTCSSLRTDFPRYLASDEEIELHYDTSSMNHILNEHVDKLLVIATSEGRKLYTTKWQQHCLIRERCLHGPTNRWADTV